MLLREYGNRVIEGYAMNSRARLALAEQDVRGAARWLVESMRLIAEADDLNILIENADLLAVLCSAHGDHSGVMEMVAVANRLQAEFHAARGPVKQAQLDDVERLARAALGQQESDAMVAVGSAHDQDTLRRRIVIIARGIVGRQHELLTPQDAAESLRGSELPEADVPHSLTAREVEILRLLAQGKSTREISDDLFISPRTTATHITNILGKLEVPSRTAAVAYAMRNRIV